MYNNVNQIPAQWNWDTPWIASHSASTFTWDIGEKSAGKGNALLYCVIVVRCTFFGCGNWLFKCVSWPSNPRYSTISRIRSDR